MVLSLSKKERALCLFNGEFLKGKVNEAKEVLITLGGDLQDDDDDDESIDGLGEFGLGGGSSKFNKNNNKPPFATPQRTKSAPVDLTTSPLLDTSLSNDQPQQATASTPTSPAAVVVKGLPPVGGEGKRGEEEERKGLKGMREIASWGTKEIMEYLRENEGEVEKGGLEGVGKPQEGKRREMEVFLEG